MPNPLFRPPRHLVKEWPEIFEDLYMNTMPVNYLEVVTFEFSDGRIWEIDICAQINEFEPGDIAEKLLNTFQEYKNEIIKIDFKINISKLKYDIANSTKDLF